MPIIASKMTVDQVIQRWKDQRREILKKLPPELRAEYERLGRLIKSLQAEQKDGTPVGVPRQQGFFDLPRIPLYKHKQKLIEYLRNRESASRVQIVKATGVPAGSLSSLLKGEEFEQVKHGLWALKKPSK